jgi:hypothetical protein
MRLSILRPDARPAVLSGRVALPGRRMLTGYLV